LAQGLRFCRIQSCAQFRTYDQRSLQGSSRFGMPPLVFRIQGGQIFQRASDLITTATALQNL
jgi:hypothetical protein